MNASWEKMLMRSGGYSLPFLINLYDTSNSISLYYVNNNADVTYNGVTYGASSFSYVPNDSVDGFDGGGTLKITAVSKIGITTDIVTLVRKYRDMKLKVIGVLLDNSVNEISKFQHHYGKVEMANNVITFTFDPDDRTQMTFPGLIWNNSNNRGNS